MAQTLRENPSLRAARWRIEEARGRVVNAGRLANPELEYSYSRTRRTGEFTANVALTQRFPLTARLPLERAVARAELAAAEAEVADGARRLALEARTAAIRLLALQSLRELRERQLQNSRELASFTQRRLSLGEASQIDTLQTDLEARQLMTEAGRLDYESATLGGELRILLGLARNSPLQVAGSLEALPSGRHGDYRQRGDLQAGSARVEAATQGSALARAERWGDFSLGFGLERARSEDAPFGLDRQSGLSFKIGIPLPVWNQGLGRVLTADAALRRTTLELDALNARVPNEITTAQQEEAAANRVVNAFETDLIPSARKIEELLNSVFNSGQTSLVEVLRARGKRFELEAQRLEALRDRQLARARLLAATSADVPPSPTRRPSK
ncbi:MAG: TolC family protein [Verrucomicrobia bacterium]|nr:TolC family protein [Verrucomicrobiota bacterium]